MSFNPLRRNTNKAPLLTVTLEDRKLCVIHDVPIEEQPVARLASEHPLLVFTDSKGQTYTHDLSSVAREGYSWVHLSIRVHEGYVCQADCLISKYNRIDETAFQKGLVTGIRFQPFYLPKCKSNPNELIGQGLFFRGLHFSGIITPGNVSASCICDFCKKKFPAPVFPRRIWGQRILLL